MITLISMVKAMGGPRVMVMVTANGAPNTSGGPVFPSSPLKIAKLELGKIEKNWGKLGKIGKNWENLGKLGKIGKNWEKLGKIWKN